MRLVTTIVSILVSLLGLCGLAYANDLYHPPERINCKLNEVNKLSCDEFDRRYLTEDLTNADMQKDKDDIFQFNYAVAYFTENHQQTTMFFTYSNHQKQVVKLRTVDPSIRPYFFNDNWKKMTDDIYTCDASYMVCSITNLPDFSK